MFKDVTVDAIGVSLRTIAGDAKTRLCLFRDDVKPEEDSSRGCEPLFCNQKRGANLRIKSTGRKEF